MTGDITHIQSSEYATVALRFTDIKDEMSIENVQTMILAICLVNNSGYNLPDGIRADLQIRHLTLS